MIDSGMNNLMDNRKIEYFRRKIKLWSSSKQIHYPWRDTKNLWHAIVAEIMLQRTKADQVLPVYKKFMDRFSTPEDFLDHIKRIDENVFENL